MRRLLPALTVALLTAAPLAAQGAEGVVQEGGVRPGEKDHGDSPDQVGREDKPEGGGQAEDGAGEIVRGRLCATAPDLPSLWKKIRRLARTYPGIVPVPHFTGRWSKSDIGIA